MNIAEAKQQIKNAMRAYFTKDEYGNFVIPPQAQRPVFLMGPPGIGKTAVMSEIASELGVGLLSYSMTHHTSQFEEPRRAQSSTALQKQPEQTD